MESRLKKLAWDVEFRSGYYDYTWKRDGNGEPLLSEELAEEFGIKELTVLEGGDFPSKENQQNIDIVEIEKRPNFRIKIDHDSDKYVLIPMKKQEIEANTPNL